MIYLFEKILRFLFLIKYIGVASINNIIWVQVYNSVICHVYCVARSPSITMYLTPFTVTYLHPPTFPSGNHQTCLSL